MKKNILTLLFVLCATFATFAQSTWSLVFPSGTFYVVPGASYSSSLCQGATGDDPVIRPIPTDPFSFVKCIPNEGRGYLFNCPAGLAFNPSLLTCDWVSNVSPYYPEFPWGDY